LLAAAFAVAAAFASPPSDAGAAELKGTFRGNVYGSEANAKAGDVAVSLGRSAYLPCPCKGTGGQTISNQITNLKAREVARADVVRSSFLTRRDASKASNVATSTISGVNLLNGLITATTLKAVATTNATSSSMSGSSAGSTFVNLKVAGKAISANIAPNSVINLAGLGKLTLKKVTNSKTSTRSDTTVEMLVIDVTVKNSFKLDIGARIVIGHAFSGYTRDVTNYSVGGMAYVTDANSSIGKDLQNRLGRAAYLSFGCEGTRNVTRTNNVAGLGVGNILTIGTGDTTGIGGQTSTGAMAKTTARVQSVRLLNGLITASVITAVAEEKVVNGKLTRSTKGTGFVGLKVLGVSIPANVPPNTKIVLPGLGYVIINEQIVPTSKSGNTEVNGLHIKITALGGLKLPVNSEILVAHAHAYVKL
jgi:hypothetical protein